ncbi:MAG: hypothetical protein KI792_09300 [Alphaproteobacteria bacterium]|nr:hypothetical protein [Alphaproteobacteria bacterium SS10]
MARAFLFGLMAMALLLSTPISEAKAQQFQGGEAGAFQQFQRVQPRAVPFGGEQAVMCVRDREIQRTGSRTCIYSCDNGSSISRQISRTRFCETSFQTTQRSLLNEIQNIEPTQCRLRRLRQTRTDKICIYDCGGETVNLPVAHSQTCDRRYSR